MRVRLSPLLSALVCPVLFTAAAAHAQQPTEVVYMLNGATIQTYNIDRDTGLATQQGQTLNLFPERGPSYADWAVVRPSADGRFLYVTGGDSEASVNFWVYATDTHGVPELPAIQKLNFGVGNNSISEFEISPNRKLAYAVESNYDAQGELLAQLRKFAVNADTGLVQEDSQAAVKYRTNLNCGSSLDSAGVSLLGFNQDGTQMYERWDCYIFHGGGTITNYYSRMVDQRTGEVGPDKFLIGADASEEIGYIVNMTPSSIVSFYLVGYTQGYNSVSVYGLNGGSPLFTCNATELEVCGYAYATSVDPSGQWLFLQTSADSTQVTRIDLAGQQIVNTNYYLEGVVQGFSPDDSFIYTQDESFSDPWIYDVYSFDPNTGAVQYTGGQIWQQTPYSTVIPALRR